MLIDIKEGGRNYQEMHVDGGAATQVFLYPPTLDLRADPLSLGRRRRRTAWVVRNGRLDVDPAVVNRNLPGIARSAAETLLHFSAVGDIQRIYLTMLRDGVAFRLAAMGPDLNAPRPAAFDNGFMRALFAYGEARGRSGEAWVDRPPPVGVLTPDLTPLERASL